ncbi:MAG: hypothetical protein PHE83_08050 [Opitutaceae bacterium]|nr:hypothetical protein [Opitutaceae bacterium]
MPSDYPITTAELVKIALNELGKEVPILGSILSTRDAVFGTIEMNRVKTILEEVARRVGSLEEAMKNQQRAQTVVYGCDQARGDILIEQKVKEYGGVIGFLAVNDVEVSEVVEVLDSLRKLSAEDLKVLHQFRIRGQIFENRQISELAGYTPYVQISGQVDPLRCEMERIFPNLMRLQGLGVLYLSDAGAGFGGALPPNIGGLTPYLTQFAFLTKIGKRLVQAMPQDGAPPTP